MKVVDYLFHNAKDDVKKISGLCESKFQQWNHLENDLEARIKEGKYKF